MELTTKTPNVVVHAVDGSLIKGTTQDFHPDRATFRIVLANGVETVPVQMADLKAVFFVKRLENSTPRPRPRKFSPQDGNRTNGRPVAALFQDGELLIGYSHSFSPDRQGFFLLPADPSDNNLRVFVVKRAVKTLKLGPPAEAFALTHTPPPHQRAA